LDATVENGQVNVVPLRRGGRETLSVFEPLTFASQPLASRDGF
jgi:hypothetical protein